MAYNHDLKIKEAILYRLKIVNRCSYDLGFRDACLVRSKKDIIWWINTFVVTYNPRVKPSILPLVLFPRQEECLRWILDCYEQGKFCTIAKARYTGASWLATCVLVHKLLFERDFLGAFASNKAENVDRLGDANTLFAKIEMTIQRLPVWMHSIDLSCDRKIKLIKNSGNNSAIIGQSGRDIGRGGRSSLVFVDEFAFVQYDVEALSALSENTNCACFISTPNGTSNKFYELCHNENIPTFTYRWEADPRRSVEWRQEQTLRFGEQITAQELDVDFTASEDMPFIQGKWVRACINAKDKIPGLAEASELKQAGLDVAGKGKNKNVLVVRKGCVVENIIVLPGDYPTQTAFRVNDILRGNGFKWLCFDADGLGLDIAGALENLDETLDYHVLEFHGAGRASEDQSWDGLELTSKDICYNARADAWLRVQTRIKKTYEHLEGIKQHELCDLISIPDDPELFFDLSKPTAKYRGSKLLIESKQGMRDRGLSSPDRADALAYAFYEQGMASYL
ncbi:MAG: hypothetical protein ACRC80_26010 [Waterburya sp.]